MARTKAKVDAPATSKIGDAAKALLPLIDAISPDEMSFLEDQKGLSDGAFATWWQMMRADIEMLAAL